MLFLLSREYKHQSLGRTNKATSPERTADTLTSPEGALVTCGVSTLQGDRVTKSLQLSLVSASGMDRGVWTQRHLQPRDFTNHTKKRRLSVLRSNEGILQTPLLKGFKERKFCLSITCDSFPLNYTFFLYLYTNFAFFFPLPLKELPYSSIYGTYHFSHSSTPAMSLS